MTTPASATTTRAVRAAAAVTVVRRLRGPGLNRDQRVTRRLPGCSWSEHEADAANGVQHSRPIAVFELAPEVTDEHVDDVGVDVPGVAPHVFEQLGTAQDLARMAGQHVEQVELPRREVQFAAAAASRAPVRLD